MQCAGERQPTVLRVKLAAKAQKLKKKKKKKQKNNFAICWSKDSTMKISEGKTAKLTV